MDNLEDAHSLELSALANARDCTSQKNYGRAFANYLVVLKLNPQTRHEIKDDFVFVMKEWSDELETGGRLADLFKCYDLACELYPDCDGMLNNIGAQLFRIGYKDEGALYVRRALKINPQFIAARENLENICSHLVERWHFRMLNDTTRNTAFYNAIGAAILQGYNTVLDIGSGTGLLSMFAVGHGATSVTACEQSKTMAMISEEVLAANHIMLHRVNVINKLSTDLSVPDDLQRVSLVVTETFDAGLFGEHVLSTLKHAWENLLLSNTDECKSLVIPQKATLYVCAVQSDAILKHNRFMYPSLKALEMSSVSIRCTTLHNWDEPYTTESLSDLSGGYTRLTPDVPFLTVNFNDIECIENLLTGDTRTFPLQISRKGRVDALVMWFDLHLINDLHLVTSPDVPNCWQQAVFPVCQVGDGSGSPTVRVGQQLEITSDCKNNKITLRCTGIRDSSTKCDNIYSKYSLVASHKSKTHTSAKSENTLYDDRIKCNNSVKFDNRVESEIHSSVTNGHHVHVTENCEMNENSLELTDLENALEGTHVCIKSRVGCEKINHDVRTDCGGESATNSATNCATNSPTNCAANSAKNCPTNCPTNCAANTNSAINCHEQQICRTINGLTSHSDVSNDKPSIEDNTQEFTFDHDTRNSIENHVSIADQNIENSTNSNHALSSSSSQIGTETRDVDIDEICMNLKSSKSVQCINLKSFKSDQCMNSESSKSDQCMNLKSSESDQCKNSKSSESDQSMNLKSPEHDQITRENFYFPRVDIARLNDIHLNSTYCESLTNILNMYHGKPLRIADITQGLSTLGLQAVKLGFHHATIYATDHKKALLQRLMKENEISDDRVSFMGEGVDLSVTGRYDVILGEIIEPCGVLRQQILEDIDLYRETSLAKGGIILPSQFTVYALCLESHDLVRLSRVENNNVTLGFGVAEFINDFQMSTHVGINLSTLSHRKLTEPFKLIHIDLNEQHDDLDLPTFLDLEQQISVKVTESGQLSAVVFWFEVTIWDNVKVCTYDASSHWKQAAIMVPGEKSLISGDEISVTCRLKNSCLDIKVGGGST